MSRRPQMPPRGSRRPQGNQNKNKKRPGHYPYHNWDDCYWDHDWYWDDDWYWYDDWYDYDWSYMAPGPKTRMAARPPMNKMPKNMYSNGCDWSNVLAYQQGYSDGFIAGVEYATGLGPTPNPPPEPTTPTTE